MKLFVGLGNPGSEYEHNRHNVGFMVLDQIAADYNAGNWSRKFQGLKADANLRGERVLLLKPQTYMNESGRSVGEAARFLKIPVEDIVVFYDEIDLTPGKLKVKTGGGNAGHNGLRSLSAHLGNDYVRVRIGVGHPGSPDRVAGYVLSNFAKADAAWLDPLIEEISKAAPRLAKGDQARFLSDVARALTPKKEPKKPKTKTPPDAATPPAPETEKSNETSAKPQDKKSESGSPLADQLQKWLRGED